MTTSVRPYSRRTVSAALQKTRILIVEDDPFLVMLLSRWLQAEPQFEVVVTEDGERGRQLALNERFDILLTDIHLPGVSGIELATQSKAVAPERVTLLMTAEESVANAMAALRLHVDDLLFKPVSSASLLATLRGAAAKIRAQRESRARVVMAIGAHPDDVEIGCGGLLIGHRQSGDRVIILTLSCGAQGGAAELRAQEAARAALAMDADLLLADLEDTRISEGPDTISVISEAISRNSPSIIYTHTAHDVHQDHRNTHRATLVAARGIPSVFCYQSPSSTIDFHPTCFVDISAHLDRKVEVLAAYATQAERRYLAPEVLRATAYYWGRFGSANAVEPLEVVRSSL